MSDRLELHLPTALRAQLESLASRAGITVETLVQSILEAHLNTLEVAATPGQDAVDAPRVTALAPTAGYSLVEAADLLKVTPSVLENAVNSGRLSSVMDGDRLRFSLRDLLAFQRSMRDEHAVNPA
jgi:excisionase family DNA binding protein